MIPVTPSALVSIDGVPFSARGVTPRLDDRSFPYGTALIELDPTPAALALDPVVNDRVFITAGDGTNTRTFDLAVTSVETTHGPEGGVIIGAATDEWGLSRYSQIFNDHDAYDLASSIRDIVNYVLDRIDAALAPGGPDPAVNFDRDDDALTWPAGTSGWDFLSPLLASVGLRLYCDEQRVWRLIDPDTRLPGVVPTVGRMIERRDAIRLDERPTGVVCVYRWRDANDNERERRDIAGTRGLVLRFDFDRPWPGAGTAARILASRTRAGRTQESTLALNLNATPRQKIGSAAEVGYGLIRGVEFDLAAGLMTLTRAPDIEDPA